MSARARAAAWLCLLIAGVAAAVYFATDQRREPTSAAAHKDRGDEDGGGEDRRLVPVPIAEVTGITIVHRGAARYFLRDDEQRWYLHAQGNDHPSPEAPGHEGSHQHAADPERAQAIAKAFAMFGHTRIERLVETGQGDGLFGTLNPEMIIALYRAGEALPFRRILVGDLAPDSLARYVLLQEELATVTIPNYQVSNLVELLSSLEGSVAGGPSPL